MRKVGKYEKMRKNVLLSSYITSILCLVLCVTMFFGTTAAWFTDTTVSEGNQIHVGTLDVDLNHATFKNGSIDSTKGTDGYVAVDNTHKVFDESIKWEPGYTAVEKFELIENGDLAFSYQLGIDCNFVDTKDGNGKTTTSAAEKETIAKAITVWSFVGENANKYDEDGLPVSFTEMVATEWVKIGTLHDVITNRTPVFQGKMAKDKVTAIKKNADGTAILENGKEVADPAKAYHLIALHMEESFGDSTVQGKILDGINIKLVATQTSSEQDAFGSDYDGDYVFVSNEDEFYKAIKNGATKLMLAEGKYNLEIYTNIQKLNAQCDSLTITGQGAGTKIEFTNRQVNLQPFKNLTISNCNIEKMNEKGWGHLAFSSSGKADGVYTISNCTFDGVGTQGIYINQEVAATFNIVNCTFNGNFGPEGAITIENTKNTNYTVNVTGCEFNNIPDTSHKIAVLYKVGNLTLNVDGVQATWNNLK